eukprot:2475233-Prymnesium_polylepis.1
MRARRPAAHARRRGPFRMPTPHAALCRARRLRAARTASGARAASDAPCRRREPRARAPRACCRGRARRQGSPAARTRGADLRP